MACRILDAEERRHLVEPPAAQLGYEATGEAHGTERLAAGGEGGKGGDAGRGALGLEEAPVEAGVVGDEHSGIECVSQTGDYVDEARAPRDHGVGDAGEAHHPGRDCGTGIEQGGEPEMHGSRLEDRDGHLEDPTTALGASAGCFHVHDRSEEHTSELQSLAYLVCRLLLEKKNIV